MILVSACLAGEPCRFDGTACPNDEIVTLVKGGGAVAACPELLGGLSVPRPAAEIIGGDGLSVMRGQARVLTIDGDDVTPAYVAGAARFAALATTHKCEKAVLKSKSPACGVGFIFDGSFSGKVQSGNGVAAAALAAEGIDVLSLD